MNSHVFWDSLSPNVIIKPERLKNSILRPSVLNLILLQDQDLLENLHRVDRSGHLLSAHHNLHH